MSAEDRQGRSPGVQILQAEKERKVYTYKRAGSTKGMFFPLPNSDDVGVRSHTGTLAIFRPTGVKDVVNGVTRIETAPNTLQNVEDAISQTLYIVPPVLLVSHQSYGRKDLKALQKSLDLIHWWDESPVSEEDLIKMHAEIYKFLEGNRFGNARDTLRQEFADNLLEGASVDSLGRVNQERSRVYAAMAHRLARLLADKNTAVWVKNALQIFPDLVNLREDERKRLERPLRIARRALSKKVDSHVVRQTQVLMNDIPSTLCFDLIPTAEYLHAAARLYFILTQHQTQNSLHQNVRKILGDTEYEKMASEKSLQEWLDQYQITPYFAADALRNLLSRVVEILDQPLEKGGRRMHEKLEKHWKKILRQTF